MGNSTSNVIAPFKKRFFNIDRIIVPNFMDIDGNNVVVGISRDKLDNPNPFSHQGIRIGNGDIHTLKYFEQSNDNIKYEFENDTTFRLFKKNNDIYYNVTTKDYNITNKLDPVIPKFYKTIDMHNCSDEIDKIGDFIKQK